MFQLVLFHICLLENVQPKKTSTLPPGIWGPWEPWKDCSKTCGIGVRRRTRACSYTGRLKSRRCKGYGGHMKNCDTKITCPVHGGWTVWTAMECTVTCGGGAGKQKRTCTNPKPKYGGKICEGPAEEEGKCNTQKCPDELFPLSPMTAQAIKNSIDNEHYSFKKKAGETVRIPCSTTVVTKVYEEYPKTTLMWTRNGKVLKIDHERMMVTPTELTINKLGRSDNGVYICRVHYAPQVVKPVTVAAVAVASSTPDIQVPEKEKLKLVCHGSSLAKIYKNVTQKWLHNNEEYKDFGSESPVVHNIYEIEKVKPNMTGKWTCKIRDSLSGKEWITNSISVKVLPAMSAFLKLFTYRNVLFFLGVILIILIMLAGIVLGYIITKAREEFLAEFEKWSQIARWEKIRAGGIPKWAQKEEKDKKDEEESETGDEI